MADNRKKQSFRPHNGLLILIGVCLFLMLISSFSDRMNNVMRSGVDSLLMPMQRGMNKAGSYVFERLENLRDLGRVREDNSRLMDELTDLREENARLKLELGELDTLQELLELKDRYPDYATVGAHITCKNSGNWYQSFLIDKGTNDGLALNMNVIAEGGLVGIITSIGSNYATVSSIINDGQYVSAMCVRTEENLIVGGDLTLYEESRLALQNIGWLSEIGTGDMIVTSNISELYLPGLLIGYVDEVTTDANQLQRSGKLIPVVDFNELDDVLVILDLKEIGDFKP